MFTPRDRRGATAWALTDCILLSLGSTEFYNAVMQFSELARLDGSTLLREMEEAVEKQLKDEHHSSLSSRANELATPLFIR